MIESGQSWSRLDYFMGRRASAGLAKFQMLPSSSPSPASLVAGVRSSSYRLRVTSGDQRHLSRSSPRKPIAGHLHLPMAGFLSKRPYEPPSWASGLHPIPAHTYSLGHVRASLPSIPPSLAVLVVERLNLLVVLVLLCYVCSSPLLFIDGTYPTCPEAPKCGSR